MNFSRCESFGIFDSNSPIIKKMKNLFNLNYYSDRYFLFSCIATDCFFLPGLLTLISNRESMLKPELPSFSEYITDTIQHVFKLTKNI